MSSQPQISVIVLTRNRLEMLRTCLTSILRQQHPAFEILILDDASDGIDTADAVAKEFADPKIRPFRSTEPLGVAGGRNLLMEQSRGEILVSIDDDAVFVDDCALNRVQESFAGSSAVGVVAFQIANVVNGIRRPLVPFSQAALCRDPTLVHRRALVSTFRGGGHALRKRVVDDLGGYRHDLTFAGEEMDLAYRVIQAGFRIMYEPGIAVDHFPMPSVVSRIGDHNASELFFHVRNRAYLAYRYLPWLYVVPYLSVWMIRYSIQSAREGGLPTFLRGLLATPKFLRGVRRDALDRKAIAYLTQHGGRLWY